DLLGHQIDVGFGLAPVHEAALESVHVAHEELLVALADTHKLCSASEIPFRELAGERWNLWRRELNPDLHEIVLGFFRNAGFTPDVHLQSLEQHEVYVWIAAELGVALVPESSTLGARPPGVVFRRLTEPRPTWEHIAIWRREEPSPIVQRFLTLLQNLAHE